MDDAENPGFAISIRNLFSAEFSNPPYSVPPLSCNITPMEARPDLLPAVKVKVPLESTRGTDENNSESGPSSRLRTKNVIACPLSLGTGEPSSFTPGKMLVAQFWILTVEFSTVITLEPSKFGFLLMFTNLDGTEPANSPLETFPSEPFLEKKFDHIFVTFSSWTLKTARIGL